MIPKRDLTEKQVKAVMSGWQKWMDIASRFEAGDQILSQKHVWESDGTRVKDIASDCDLCNLVRDIFGEVDCKLCPYVQMYHNTYDTPGESWRAWDRVPSYETAYAMAESLAKIIFPY